MTIVKNEQMKEKEELVERLEDVSNMLSTKTVELANTKQDKGNLEAELISVEAELKEEREKMRNSDTAVAALARSFGEMIVAKDKNKISLTTECENLKMRIEELEGNKLSSRVAEAEETIDSLNTKKVEEISEANDEESDYEVLQ